MRHDLSTRTNMSLVADQIVKSVCRRLAMAMASSAYLLTYLLTYSSRRRRCHII